jgi:hypothetical protein
MYERSSVFTTKWVPRATGSRGAGGG